LHPVNGTPDTTRAVAGTAALLISTENERPPKMEVKKQGLNAMPPRGLLVNPCFLLDEVEYTIERPPTRPSQRNLEIYRRHAAGERAIDLAAEYGVSWQRVYQIVKQVNDLRDRTNDDEPRKTLSQGRVSN
jgi:hypothetical protein